MYNKKKILIMENRFTTASEKERRLTRNFLSQNKSIKELEFTSTTGYDRYDGKFYSEKLNDCVFFETKVRNNSSEAFKTTGIEESKFNYLLSIDKPAFVFVFFNDNKVLVHKIDKQVNYIYTEINAPKETCGDKTKIKKPFVDIVIKKEEIYEYTNIN